MTPGSGIFFLIRIRNSGPADKAIRYQHVNPHLFYLHFRPLSGGWPPPGRAQVGHPGHRQRCPPRGRDATLTYKHLFILDILT